MEFIFGATAIVCGMFVGFLLGATFMMILMGLALKRLGVTVGAAKTQDETVKILKQLPNDIARAIRDAMAQAVN